MKSVSSILLRFVAVGCISAFTFEAALGQDARVEWEEVDSIYLSLESRILELDAARVKASVKDAARPTVRPSQILDAKILDQIPAASRVEALAALPGVSMVSNGGGTMRPVIRGLSGLRIATLFNGARIESQAWGEYHGIYLPEEGVQAVEVIRGPATLAYGSDAYGGVLNFIPRAPLSEKGRESRLSLSGFSATAGWQLTAATEKRSAQAFHAFRGGFKEHENYQLPSGDRVAHSAYRQFFGQGAYGYIRSWGVVEGAYSSAYNSAGLVGHEGWQQSGDHLITTSIRSSWRGWDLSPRVSYQLNHRKEFETEFGTTGQEPDADLEALALDISLRTWRWDATVHRDELGAWSTTMGIQGFSTTSQFDEDESVVLTHAPLIPNSGADEISAFTVWNRDFERAGLQGAGRVDRRVTESSVARTDWLTSLSFGGHWQAGEHVVMRMHAAHSERVPGLSELYSQGVHHCAFRFEQGQENLGKERSFNLESSLDYQSEWGAFEWVVYQNDIRGYVQMVPKYLEVEGWQVHAWEATDALFRGTECSLSLAPQDWDHLHAEGVFSWVDARNRDGILLPMIPPATTRVVLGWRDGSMGRLDGLFGQAVWNHSRDASLLHLAAGTRLGSALNVNVTVQNLWNAEYIPTLSLLRNLGIPEPGRNIRVQLEWVF